MFASVFGGLSSSLMPSSAQPRTRASSAKSAEAAQPAKPAWMAEMEALDDEKGVTCAVCQEGRTFQPSELLGLYAYMKKVTIAAGQGGATGDIDGTVMLLSLPMSLPRSSVEAWFRKARVAANALEGSAHAITAMSAANSTSSGSSGRSNHFITTVSAGNAIHCSCHSKAKAADRNHPKAPKSEWEGASLRNSRVTCNVILPLVSTKTSSVPLMSVENALADVNNVMANTLGVRPKSTLWGCLHDIRFLLLRMAYGEALNADCGGGSSSSNFLLALYQLYTADMFAANAEHDESPEVSKHARNLSYGFLLGEDIVDLPTFDRNLNSRSKRLERGVAESAPMAALCSILFYNVEDETGSGTKNGKCLSPTGKAPSPTRQWEVNKDIFLAGLIRCAGHRHSLGLTDSGCATSKGLSAGRKNVEKTRSFADWRKDDIRSQHKTAMIDDYGQALRPMITLYAVFDQLSREFVVNDDESTEATSERLAARLESCYKAGDIEELLQVAEIAMSRDLICKYFEKGCTS
uniref:E3 ubiquitin ligase UBR4 C-terminal domain-containing protein n=1 Tax=Skeletonema marinoi TaxID=267567 RepID=A0A7S2LR68_9STRA